MLMGVLVGFLTWSVYLTIQILVIVVKEKNKELSPLKLMERLVIALIAGLIWGGILKYAITGSPH